jgi:hypothetical protein
MIAHVHGGDPHLVMAATSIGDEQRDASSGARPLVTGGRSSACLRPHSPC